jgi:hypothetical protein
MQSAVHARQKLKRLWREFKQSFKVPLPEKPTIVPLVHFHSKGGIRRFFLQSLALVGDLAGPHYGG